MNSNDGAWCVYVVYECMCASKRVCMFVVVKQTIKQTMDVVCMWYMSVCVCTYVCERTDVYVCGGYARQLTWVFLFVLSKLFSFYSLGGFLPASVACWACVHECCAILKRGPFKFCWRSASNTCIKFPVHCDRSLCPFVPIKKLPSLSFNHPKIHLNFFLILAIPQ